MTTSSGISFRASRVMMWIGVALLILGTAAIAVVSLSPKRYFAVTTIETREDETSNCVPHRANENYNHQFLISQLSILQKREILLPVIDRLDLRTVFARGSQPLAQEDAYRFLLRSMDLHIPSEPRVSEPLLLQIGVYSHDPIIAADIANAIVLVYREKRVGLAETFVQRSISNLEDELRKKTKDVEQAAAEAARLRTLHGLTDSNPEDYAAKVTREDRSSDDFRAAAQRKKELGEYIDAKTRYVTGRKLMAMVQESLRAERERTRKRREVVSIRQPAEPPKGPIRAWWRWRLL